MTEGAEALKPGATPAGRHFCGAQALNLRLLGENQLGIGQAQPSDLHVHRAVVDLRFEHAPCSNGRGHQGGHSCQVGWPDLIGAGSGLGPESRAALVRRVQAAVARAALVQPRCHGVPDPTAASRQQSGLGEMIGEPVLPARCLPPQLRPFVSCNGVKRQRQTQLVS
jgi:hypothetical protein